MPVINEETIRVYRRKTFRLSPNLRLKNADEAYAYVNERGFAYFWPIKGITLPSLWAAVAGERPVADAHDDPGHITWGWKDGALGKRIWYYGKILRKKATVISLDVAPFFYALSENYGDPEEDVRIAYQDGRLTLEAKSIFEALLDHGAMDTIALRRATHMTSRESDTRFERALALLQADFKILPIGISDAGAWRYAFIYDAVHRHYPELPERARSITEREARQKLLELYFLSVGVAQKRDISLLFGWTSKEIDRSVQALVESEFLLESQKYGNQSGTWYVITGLAK